MQYKTKKDVENAINELRRKSLLYSRLYLYTVESKANFALEIDRLIITAEQEIRNHCISYHGAFTMINEEISFLDNQTFQIDMGRMKFYMAIEKQKTDRLVNLIMKEVGFLSGISQVIAGSGACTASAGLACAGFGTPLILHGANNIYENGYYLLFTKEKVGTVKSAYHFAANTLGYSNNTADKIYGSVDLVLSGYGMARQIVRPDSWRLYRYINSDYIRGWQQMGMAGLALEGISDASTIFGIYKIGNNGENNEQ
ncbi:DUF4225 domain-containing protein [Serratia rubidaea]|uniref:DUF4225 domain-containing protein n=1 Tax=Serratia rubidaea TaxID=61652 RepID=A0ABS0M8Z4_SERRU|nr:DUF4225 domain-containing protein [Serratia rubidaea]MBH1928752.1 DUF4225 domain-containing protein [Serratia rubidaea]